jgi:hypothetical protein
MPANEDFLKLKITDVTFYWPRLDKPYRYNNATKRTEACEPNVSGAGFSIAWDMPKGEARDFYKALAEHYAGCQKRNPKLPAFKEVFGMKADPNGDTVRFTAKRKAITNAGEVNRPPRVADGTKAGFPDLADPAIWSGSKGHLRVFAFPATDPQGNGGISLLLDAVIVTGAQYGGDGLEDDFEVSAPKAGADPFAAMDAGTPQQNAVAAAKAAPVPADAPF